jgi:putative transposase
VDTKPKTPAFDPQLINQLLSGRQTAGEIEDLLKELRKAFIESALEGELTHLLGYRKHDREFSFCPSGRHSGNSRNGSSRKRVKTDGAEREQEGSFPVREQEGSFPVVEVQIPGDRQGEFEPQLVAKHQRRWDGFDETILALYARGMTTREVQSFLSEKYDNREGNFLLPIEVAPEFISSVCESVSAGVQEWRTRPLAAVWPRLYLDALFLKVREQGRVVKQALYLAVGVKLLGRKERLGRLSARARGRSSTSSCSPNSSHAGWKTSSLPAATDLRACRKPSRVSSPTRPCRPVWGTWCAIV